MTELSLTECKTTSLTQVGRVRYVIDMPQERTQCVLRVVEMIHRLPVEIQQRVATLVDLLLEAPAPLGERAQGMIQAALDEERVSPDQCLLDIERVIAYLRNERLIYETNDIVLSS